MGPERVVELGGEGGVVGQSCPQAGGRGERRAHQAAAAPSPRYGSARSSAGGGGCVVELRGRGKPARGEREQVAPPGERLDQEPGRDVGGGRPGQAGEAAVEVVGPAREVLAGERPSEVLLGREVAEDRALGDPGPLGDVGRRSARRSRRRRRRPPRTRGSGGAGRPLPGRFALVADPRSVT